LKLGLARIYLQSGNKAQAKELLEPLAQLGSKFSEQDEVKSLLAGI
jgi:cellulose synthase operon protein C